MAELDPVDLATETLVEGAGTALAVAAGHQVLAEQGDAIVLVEAGSPVPTTLDQNRLGLVDAARLPGRQLLVATDDDLRVWVDERLEPSELGDAVGGPVAALAPQGEILWLSAGGALYRLQGSQLDRLDLAGATPTGPLAAGPQAGGTLWVATDEGLLGLDGATLELLEEQPDVDAGSLAVDAAGEVYAVDADALWHRQAGSGHWTRYRADAALLSVHASPEAAGAWIRTDGPLLHVQGETFRRAEPSGVQVARADELGRLVLSDGAAVLRVGIGRAVAVVGLDDGDRLAGQHELLLAPSRVGEVVALSATVDGQPLEVDLDAGVVLLDAAAYAAGEEHAFQALARWDDGVEASSPVLRFTVDYTGDVTWIDDVEPLYQERCAICHGGDSETQLHSAELWEANIELILQMVSSGAMPIGGDSLSASEIAMLEAWRDGGFE